MVPSQLADLLTELGVEVRRVSGDEVLCRCPVHVKYKGRESSGYSFSMNAETGLYQCFTCGARGHLRWLVSELADDSADLWRIQTQIITTGVLRANGYESQYDPEVTEHVSWDDLRKMKLVPERQAAKRNLDPDVLFRRMVRWDKGWIIPIVSPYQYELIGWQRKTLDGNYNFPNGVPKGRTFFGIEFAHNPTALLVESPLDVIRFHSVYKGDEFSCIASFGAGVTDEQVVLASDRFDRIVLALDNDSTGKRETERVAPRFGYPRRGLYYWNYKKDDPKDIGEMTDEAILEGLDRITQVRPK